jgi:hypothetical protein
MQVKLLFVVFLRFYAAYCLLRNKLSEVPEDGLRVARYAQLARRSVSVTCIAELLLGIQVSAETPPLGHKTFNPGGDTCVYFEYSSSSKKYTPTATVRPQGFRPRSRFSASSFAKSSSTLLVYVSTLSRIVCLRRSICPSVSFSV